jgi:hypothetical protein
MCADETEEDSEQHPKNKWYNHKPSVLWKAIAGLVVYGLFIFIDVKDFWPTSHLFAFIFGVIVTIALVYDEWVCWNSYQLILLKGRACHLSIGNKNRLQSHH